MSKKHPFKIGDRVTERVNGIGTVVHLHGDLVPDGSGKRYNWTGCVCVRFDKPINGEIIEEWNKFEQLRKVE